MSDTHSAINHRAVEMAMTRKRIACSSWERQRAVCMFPLMVASIASDMQKLLDALQYAEATPESIALLEHMETIIRDAYRSQFGRELGQ